MANCPSCNSSNTKTLNMVWSGGTRNGKSGFGGVGISTSGRITVGGGRGRSSSQSNLAATCAPPKKSSLPKLVILVLVLMFWIPLFSAVVSVFSAPTFFKGLGTFVVTAPLLGLLTYGLIRLYRKMNATAKNAESNYARTWICLKCGSRFIPYAYSENKTKAEAGKLTRELDDLLSKRKAP